MLTRLMCTARAVADGHHDIDTIAALSCAALETLGVTGVQLVGEGGRMMYCLEGDAADVRHGYAAIAGDPGLRDASLVTMVAIQQRRFEELVSMQLDVTGRREPGINQALALLQARPAMPAPLAA